MKRTMDEPTWIDALLADRGWDGSGHRLVGIDQSPHAHQQITQAWCECGWHSEAITGRDDQAASRAAAQAHSIHVRSLRDTGADQAT
jgi:hypothetical protein